MGKYFHLSGCSINNVFQKKFVLFAVFLFFVSELTPAAEKDCLMTYLIPSPHLPALLVTTRVAANEWDFGLWFVDFRFSVHGLHG